MDFTVLCFLVSSSRLPWILFCSAPVVNVLHRKMSGRKNVEDLEFVEGALGAVFPIVSHFKAECGNQNNKMMEESQCRCKKDGDGVRQGFQPAGQTSWHCPGQRLVRTLVRQRCCGPDPLGSTWVIGQGISHCPHPLPFVKEQPRAIKAEHLGQPGCGAVQCWDCSRSLRENHAVPWGLGIRHLHGATPGSIRSTPR